MEGKAIDLDPDPIADFRLQDWIAKNKTYPLKPPAQLLDARQQALEIPPLFSALIPNPALSIIDFLQTQLPGQRGGFAFLSVINWFSHEKPNADLTCILDQPIPPSDVITDLYREFNDHWIQGAQCIIDVRLKQQRYPLWILSWWSSMNHALAVRRKWSASVDWLRSHVRGDDEKVQQLAQMARGVYGRLGWGVTFEGAQCKLESSALAPLLGYHMINGALLDTMFEYIGKEVERDPHASTTTIIATLAFSYSLAAYCDEKSGDCNPPILADYEDLINAKGRKLIYFPLNLDGNDWITGCVNFYKGEISYGDSCHMGPIQSESLDLRTKLNELEQWLNNKFKLYWKRTGNTLPHGLQEDGVSCAFCAANTVTHSVLHDPRWTVNEKAGARISWFINLVKSKFGSDFVPPIPTRRPSPTPGITPQPNTQPMQISRGRSALAISALLNHEQVGEDVPMHIIQDIADGTTFSETLLELEEEERLEKRKRKADSLTDTFRPAEPHTINRQRASVTEDSDVDSTASTSTAAELAWDSSSDGAPPSSVATSNGHESEVDNEFKTDSDGTDDDWQPKKKKARYRRAVPKGSGTSRAAIHARKANAAVKAGTYQVDDDRFAKFRNKILAIDPGAEFDPSDILSVRHKKCGEWKKMRNPYDIKNFKTHADTCKPSKKALRTTAGTSTLGGMGFFKSKGASMDATDEQLSSEESLPEELWTTCLGLRQHHSKKITRYLSRTGSSGGGASSVTKIAKKKYGVAMSLLSPNEQAEVYVDQILDHKWKNDPEAGAVRSAECLKEVKSDGKDPDTCKKCLKILKLKGFKNAINVPIPDAINYRNLNIRFRGKTLAEIYARTQGLSGLMDLDHPALEYTKGVLAGKYTDEAVFNGMVEAFVTKIDRAAKGRGMQGYKYPLAFDEFASLLVTTSPRAYKHFRAHFATRSQRSFQYKRAAEPKFEFGIHQKGLLRGAEYAKEVKAKEVAVACDDSKVHPGIRTYRDAATGKDYVTGFEGDPMEIADAEALQELLKDTQRRRATKVRLWTMTVPVPGIPTLLLAIKAIPSDLKADQLYEYSHEIIQGLSDMGLHVVSYACDGTEVERSVQRLIVQKAPTRKVTLRYPDEPSRNINLTIPLYNNKPVIMIQDSKHGLKTMRNNAYSGARALIIGAFIITYAMIRHIAYALTTPPGTLYRRDVEKVDRQDDAAATRLFSAPTVEWLAEHASNEPGLIVYLFVFGELIDAYQNRFIPHIERARMVCRAHYFMLLWRSFLAQMGYPENKYCISREAIDILDILIQGLLSLIVAYRDDVNADSVQPLLPWLHSSEPCEHAFGEMRRIVKDFTVQDVMDMMPKLRALMLATARSHLAPKGTEKATGYSHTYFDVKGMNLANLSIFPSNSEISDAMMNAYDEASSLFALLGVSAASLSQPNEVRLPTISSWFVETSPGNDEDFGIGLEDLSDDEIECATKLQELIDLEDSSTAPFRTLGTDKSILNLTMASAALTAENTMRISGLPDVSEEDRQYEAEQIRCFLTRDIELPSILGANTEYVDSSSRPLSDLDSIDYSAIIQLRKEHQTRFAAKGVRTQNREPNQSKEGEYLRKELLRKFEDVIRQSNDQGESTGLERQSRYGKSAPGGGAAKDNPTAHGNVLNAAQAATKTATAVKQKRNKVFREQGMPEYELCADAGITDLEANRIRPGSYGIVVDNGKIHLGKVLDLYSKSTGKGSAHAWVSESNNIGAISNINLLLFDHFNKTRFRPTATPLQVRRYCQIPSSHFLFKLRGKVNVVEGGFLDITLLDYEIVKNIIAKPAVVLKALKALTARSKQKKQNGVTAIMESDEDN
ncbi:hypothetical protein SISSUDRAFT_1127329 [Sistotremastrum suecicum HHB10207 ss-3]|uniref:Uncharacterized protein n=1 Tax=Sistotremastrum suecicum HHB10207 ss-3 TaxID=1314776 RepID=A0A166F5G3_9AGAM|nr:hypothetical protein SISSUDRAFT_1127329 [Sistotremastrum suecicum HHB10207 ss-3]